MRQSRLWIEIAVVVLVAAAAFFVGRAFPYSGSQIAQQDQAPVPQEESSPTRDDVPPGTIVPGMDEGNLPPDVAAPQAVKPAGGPTNLYLRTFNITVANDKISQNNIVSKLGDIITVTFQSSDKAYDFVQPDHGLSWTVPAGGSKTFQFQASNSGKFIFYCPSCGGPDAGPTGYFTIVK